MDEYDHYFEILGIPPESPLDEIRVAYRDLVQVWHPDRFRGKPERLQKKAEEKMKTINEAYEILCGRATSVENPQSPDNGTSGSKKDNVNHTPSKKSRAVRKRPNIICPRCKQSNRVGSTGLGVLYFFGWSFACKSCGAKLQIETIKNNIKDAIKPFGGLFFVVGTVGARAFSQLSPKSQNTVGLCLLTPA